jgi:N-hydroxyarylamine O-acetyltransferase
MKAGNFTLERYLERIAYQGIAQANFSTLRMLMRSQLFSVPFENLDVQAGKVVSLVPEEIVEKILRHRRGGYCYEVNGLFAMALESLGIPYQFIAARPMFYPVRRPRTHMAVVAKLEGELWLCDLGFGSYGIREPMRLSLLDTEVKQDNDFYKLSKTGEHEYLLQARVDGEWSNQYGFDLSPHEWVDFVPANYFNSTHPDTIFVQKLLVVLHNPTGREILLDDVLKTVCNGETTKRNVTKDERAALLKDRFGLVAAKQ